MFGDNTARKEYIDFLHRRAINVALAADLVQTSVGNYLSYRWRKDVLTFTAARNHAKQDF